MERNDFGTSAGCNRDVIHTKPWKVLSIEDNLGFQDSIELALSSLSVDHCPVELLTANNVHQATKILTEESDIALILLDVVMEEDDSGLKLIDTIRTLFADQLVRIVLLTGQPGMAPRRSVMEDYDINEYWLKSDLSLQKLHSVVTSNVRTWYSMRQLQHAQKGLQAIIDLSTELADKQDLNVFAQNILDGIHKLLDQQSSSGIIFVHQPHNNHLNDANIVAASGCFSVSKSSSIVDVLAERLPKDYETIVAAINDAIEKEESQFHTRFSVILVDSPLPNIGQHIILTYANSPVDKGHIALFKVFAQHIHSRFSNVILLNRVTQLAYEDLEFSIPNRNWLLRELNNLSFAQRAKSHLLILDVVEFTATQISFGSRFAKTLVEGLYQYIRDTLKGAYAIARTGDDSFAVLYAEQNAISDEALNSLSQPRLTIDGLPYHLRVNVGMMPLNFDQPIAADNLLKTVEAAVYKARLRGIHVSRFSHAMLDKLSQRYELLRQLHQALESSDQLYMVYQPKVDMTTGATRGFEALLRWRLPNGEFVSPAVFIPIAEQAGLITKLTNVVVDMISKDLHTMQDANVKVPISMNVTKEDLLDSILVERILSLVEHHDLEPEYFEIEVTESQFMEEYQEINSILAKFHEHGVRVSIDDFGTGYSSLSHLTQLKATTLKLDRSFVMSLDTEDSTPAKHVTEMVMRISQRFGLSLVAEGIETEAQRQALIEQGYHIGQGFLFSRPLPLIEAIMFATNTQRP